MNIGEAARRSGLPVKTVRYYADIALVAPPRRSDSGYRHYDAEDVARLVFVRRARAFGFSIDDCRELLSLYDDEQRSAAEVKEIALRHLADLDVKLAELHALRDGLARLVAACAGDQRRECPILEGLATGR